jgi:hypothetical protein
MSSVIEGFRFALAGRGRSPGLLEIVSAGTVLLPLTGGLFFFQRIEGTIADRVLQREESGFFGNESAELEMRSAKERSNRVSNR